MKRLWYTPAVLLLALSVTAFGADTVMFNYQGRVKVHGTPFDGNGLFKFVIVNTSGDTTLWSNDGTSVNGSEPTASIEIAVMDGVFDVMVGDATVGMDPINSTVFNYPTPVKLRIWFSDGTHGFQQLLPDHTLVNPQLIGLTSGTQDFTIYVNGATGVDTNSGLTSATAKKTIQAAVDVLPERLRCNVTIDIADGVYREQVTVFGIVVQPGKTLLFKGDEAWSPASPGDPAVRITGADDDTSHTPVRIHCFQIQKCSGVEVRGILADYCLDEGFVNMEGSAIFRNCKADHCGVVGIDIRHSATGICYSCVVEHCGEYGFLTADSSSSTMYDCVARYNYYGVTSVTDSQINFDSSGVFSDNSNVGVMVSQQARVIFFDTYSGQIQNNGLYGLDIRYYSYSEDDTRNAYAGNGTANVHLQWGGAQFY